MSNPGTIATPSFDWSRFVRFASARYVRSSCINQGKRRNIRRYALLTLVARPGLDHVTDGDAGQAARTEPALKVEVDPVTSPARWESLETSWSIIREA